MPVYIFGCVITLVVGLLFGPAAALGVCVGFVPAYFGTMLAPRPSPDSPKPRVMSAAEKAEVAHQQARAVLVEDEQRHRATRDALALQRALQRIRKEGAPKTV